MSNELNEEVLDSTLAQLPQLLGLHVIGCPKISYIFLLKAVSHTPILESLACSAAVSKSTTSSTLSSIDVNSRNLHVPSNFPNPHFSISSIWLLTPGRSLVAQYPLLFFLQS
jgi:hypothetical protein